MSKTLIVYATRSGQTQRIGELIAEGLRMSGSEVELKNVTEIKNPEQLNGYDAYLFGSATYHGEMMPSMKQFLFLAEQAELEGKCGGSFGSYGWSGEAPPRIYETMKNIFKMNMGGDCLRLKSADLEGGVQMAQSYGKELAQLTA
ncbi:MAG: flavodoxin domain-containing protein [Desulfarculaceae bacterium]|nr:flavodoxin domain-containing protein [Desulfarculaceae bacterium]MCF8072394.1 flavodoxin domain-containing protein [Desulfarculaceae bacterium]MCF8100315.1 flavodoxin domain-containing protein [Desulfarculaceae bacterium]MCF8117918.1 flavodoxin domain-containing protein [Desulfarculaceae bacterium]